MWGQGAEEGQRDGGGEQEGRAGSEKATTSEGEEVLEPRAEKGTSWSTSWSIEIGLRGNGWTYQDSARDGHSEARAGAGFKDQRR